MNPSELEKMIHLKSEAGSFKLRAAAVIMKNGETPHVLLNRKSHEDRWVLPGGTCEIGEDSARTLERELMEEGQQQVKAGRLLWVVEYSLVEGSRSESELNLVYAADLAEESPWRKGDGPFRGKEGSEALEFCWFPVDGLKDMDEPLYPSFLRFALKVLPAETQHRIERDLVLTDRFAEAFHYALQLHRHQVRKETTIPYISHLMAVAAIVLEHGGGEEEAIAALLHDAVEDQGGKEIEAEIKARFGEPVRRIVRGCSDTDVKPKPPWEERKRIYLGHLKHADNSTRLVSAADKLHNARMILADYRVMGDDLWERFNGKKAGTRWYYDELEKIFKEFGPRAIGEELERVLSEWPPLGSS